MSLLCRIGLHAAADESAIWNSGHFFSRCARCGRDLVRRHSGRRWHAPPRGMRVVWRAREGRAANWKPVTGKGESESPAPTARAERGGTAKAARTATISFRF
jgi:hypothetical protein